MYCATLIISFVVSFQNGRSGGTESGLVQLKDVIAPQECETRTEFCNLTFKWSS